MLDLMFIALFQAAAGAPDASAPASEAAVQQTAPVGGSAQTVAPTQPATPVSNIEAAHKRTCHRVQATGSRLPIMSCSDAHTDQEQQNDARDTLHTPMSTLPRG